MPTLNTVEPIAPADKQYRTPSESVAFGRAQWTLKWKRFARQWSQPQLMKLADAVLGEKAIHSSQIHGFTTGKLRDPAPKVLLSIGQLNEAIWFANNKEQWGKDKTASELRSDMPDRVYPIPETLAELWQGRQAMTDRDGVPLTPSRCFEAFTGLYDLGVFGQVRAGVLNEETMGAVSKQLGKIVRRCLMEQGIDFMDPDWITSVDTVPHQLLEQVIYGKQLTAHDMETHVDAIAALVEMDPVELWDEATTPALS